MSFFTNGTNNYNVNVGTLGNSSHNGTWSTTTTTAPASTISASDIIVDGCSFKKFMEDVDQRLALLRPNVELESKWNQLRDIREQYLKLEKEILEKERMINLLKEQA